MKQFDNLHGNKKGPKVTRTMENKLEAVYYLILKLIKSENQNDMILRTKLKNT